MKMRGELPLSWSFSCFSMGDLELMLMVDGQSLFCIIFMAFREDDLQRSPPLSLPH
jgi:hypothetical protein